MTPWGETFRFLYLCLSEQYTAIETEQQNTILPCFFFSGLLYKQSHVTRVVYFLQLRKVLCPFWLVEFSFFVSLIFYFFFFRNVNVIHLVGP